jgi:hypothetical protein
VKVEGHQNINVHTALPKEGSGQLPFLGCMPNNHGQFYFTVIFILFLDKVRRFTMITSSANTLTHNNNHHDHHRPHPTAPTPNRHCFT